MGKLPVVAEETCNELALVLGDSSYEASLTTWVKQLRSENPELHEFVCAVIEAGHFSADGAVLVAIVYALLNAQIAADEAVI